MSDLKPEKPTVVRFSVTVTRADTGKKEQVEFVGHIQPIAEEEQDGRDPH